MTRLVRPARRGMWAIAALLGLGVLDLAVDPARTLEITNATAVDRQYAVTTRVAGGR